MVSISSNKIHQTWGPPFSRALYRCNFVNWNSSSRVNSTPCAARTWEDPLLPSSLCSSTSQFIPIPFLRVRISGMLIGQVGGRGRARTQHLSPSGVLGRFFPLPFLSLWTKCVTLAHCPCDPCMAKRVHCSLQILGPNLIFVCGLVKFFPAPARLVCPDLLGWCLSRSANINFGPSTPWPRGDETGMFWQERNDDGPP